jgi:hypothetical protein
VGKREPDRHCTSGSVINHGRWKDWTRQQVRHGAATDGSLQAGGPLPFHNQRYAARRALYTVGTRGSIVAAGEAGRGQGTERYRSTLAEAGLKQQNGRVLAPSLPLCVGCTVLELESRLAGVVVIAAVGSTVQ